MSTVTPCEIATQLAERVAYQEVLLWLEQTAMTDEKASDLFKNFQAFLNEKIKTA
ncbi:MAG: hypothetical protein Q4E21_00635 [Clostridia bacterium]|nr:hypothetical protein [Clostridia bacterium]